MDMTKDEFGVLVKSLKAVYTDTKFIPDQEAFEVWFSLLGDLDYRMAMAAVKKHMLTNRFAPAISEIREKYAEVEMGDQMTGNEAWALVSKALRNGAYHYVEEFEKLPPTVQRAVGSPEQLHVMALSENYNEDVARSNFLRSYDVAMTQEKQKAQMTPDILRIVEDTTKKLEG